MQRPAPAIAGEAPNLHGKEAVLKYLQASFEDVRLAIADMEKGDAMELVKSGERMVPRLSVSIGIIAHGWNHYGQTTQYLRAVGVVPPASR